MRHVIIDLQKFFENNQIEWNKEKSEYAYRIICMLQHERLVHLLVTLFTFAGTLFAAVLSLLLPSTYARILGAVVTVLLCCYIHYYWYLENSVQKLYDKLIELDKQLL